MTYQRPTNPILAGARAGIAAAQADMAWPTPDLSVLRNERAAAPAFPRAVLPPFFRRFAAEAAEGAGAPEAFVGSALLAVAAGTIGNARWVSPWPQWELPPVFNAALIGQPSSGKSPALATITRLANRLEAEDNLDWGERRREGAARALEAAERRRAYEDDVKAAVSMNRPPPLMPEQAMAPPAPQRRRLTTTDPTAEKAARLSAANPRGLLLIRDELAGWLGNMNRYASGMGGDRAFWLESYNGSTFAPDRVRDGEDGIAVPHLTWGVVGTIQPDRLASLLLAGDDDGMMARFLPVWPERIPPARPRAIADEEGAYLALRRLRTLPWAEAPTPRLVKLAEAALTVLDAWRERAAALETSAAGLMIGWLGKLPGLALRLALTLEYLAWAESDGAAEPTAVSATAMDAAVTFLEHFAIPMARRTFGAAALPQAERDATRLATWLARQRPMPAVVNARALRHTGEGLAIPEAGRMEAALGELADAGWLREAPFEPIGRGRPRKDWTINPDLCSALAQVEA